MKSEEKEVREGDLRPTHSPKASPFQAAPCLTEEERGWRYMRMLPQDMGPEKFPPPTASVYRCVCGGRVSPPFRWQAGKVWQGVGSAVRLPPRSPPWWVLVSRPSAPWLLTGIPDTIGPLSSRSTLAGPSALPFQDLALSSFSAGMTRRAQCLYVGGVLLFS